MEPLLALYRLLLRLYPRDFRRRFGADAVEDLRRRSREARFRSVPGGRLRFLLFVLADVARSLPRAHARALRRRLRPGRRDPSRGEPVIASILTDLRFGLRGFLERPGFTLAAAATLALGIGATTAIFSVTDAVLLRPLPYPDADRLVQLGARYEDYDGLGSVSPPDFRDWRERAGSFRELAASRLERRILRADGRPTFVNTAGVSRSFFRLLGVEPARGRGFSTSRETAGAPAVVSHGFWTRRMGGDPDPTGRTLRLDDVTFTVVGVLPPDFHPPEPLYQQDTEVWYPLRWVDDPLDERGTAFLQVMGRLEAGVSLAAARDEMDALARALTREYPESGERRIGIEPLRERTVAGVGSTLWLFLGAVGLLLVIACANVAHLFLVRAGERRREMAVRTALGASRGRIVRQLLTESLALSLAGGVLGGGLAWLGIRAFKGLAPGAGTPRSILPRLSEVGIDPRVLAFAAGLAVLTGVVFGLVPALGLRRGRTGEALKEGATASTPGRRRGRLRSLLLVAETSISLVLLFGAGLLVHSFVRLSSVDPGFETEGVARAEVVTGEDYETGEARKRFFERVVRGLERDPGVVSAGATHSLPLDGNRAVATVTVEGREYARDEERPRLGFHQVTPGYFRTLGVERVRGRSFGWDDDADAPPVAVVNESMARRFWPEDDPLGRRVRFGGADADAPWLTVVGVVRDVRQHGLARETGAELFIPFLQSPRSRMQVVARTGGDAGALVPLLRDAVSRVDPELPVRSAGTLRDHVSGSLAGPRFYTALLGTFAGIALVLTFVGVYGTVSYSVEQRSREMGIRMALGAGAGAVTRMVVREGMARAGAGIVLGLGGAWAGGRLLEGLIYGLSPTDPVTLAVVGLSLAGLTLLACYLPARRVGRIDPMATLRTE